MSDFTPEPFNGHNPNLLDGDQYFAEVQQHCMETLTEHARNDEAQVRVYEERTNLNRLALRHELLALSYTVIGGLGGAVTYEAFVQGSSVFEKVAGVAITALGAVSAGVSAERTLEAMDAAENLGQQNISS